MKVIGKINAGVPIKRLSDRLKADKSDTEIYRIINGINIYGGMRILKGKEYEFDGDTIKGFDKIWNREIDLTQLFDIQVKKKDKIKEKIKEK